MKCNIMVEGDQNTGKTYSLRTLLQCELEPFVISVEPNIEAALPVCPASGIHYRYIPPAQVSWATVRKYVNAASSVTMEQLAKMADPDRGQYNGFRTVFSTCENFVCDGCHEAFGDISLWGEERVICLDSLTGLTKMALQTVVGGKPIRSLPEYGAAMEFLEVFASLFWGNTRCSAVMLAHIDREISPITGLHVITLHTIGQKLAPKLLKMPDEVILSEKINGRFTWSTDNRDTVTKNRRLPIASGLAQDFRQLFKQS